ncbi:MAG: hypothetical protein SFU87_05125 [Chitinophagaceae bacterium]|nr:hypothetical protein [Chitinophagaceae bacterium]
MPKLNHRAYCHTHGYLDKGKWKTEEQAKRDKESHVETYPDDKVQIEERQTAGQLRKNFLSQQLLVVTALELLADNTPHDEEVGACIIKLPTGEAKCYQLTRSQCKTLGGEYIGGKC